MPKRPAEVKAEGFASAVRMRSLCAYRALHGYGRAEPGGHAARRLGTLLLHASLKTHHETMSKLKHTRLKIYKTIARQLHGKVPCWVCREHVEINDATLEHIQPLSEGGNSHIENLAISHARCNHQRHAALPAAKTVAV